MSGVLHRCLCCLLACLVWPLAVTAQDSEDTEEPFDPWAKPVQRLTNLPHIYIDTFTGNAITSKTTYVYARMWYVSEEDIVQFFDSLQIRGRGNSTWGLAKKPYKLKFHEKEKLLGTGYAKAKKWTLMANHADKSLIRNALTSLMGEQAGLPFNPAAKFVDLTLNDQYVGNYQISDQVEVRAHRVKTNEQDYPLTEDSDISGGNAAPGTPILSYTNDARNASSNNRKWRIEAVGRVEPDGPDNPDDPDNPSVGIGNLSTLDYALAYDPQSGRLHFGSYDLAALTFPVRVYDRSGRLVRTFRASAGTSLAALPRGLYLITWTFAGHRRTVKLLK